MYALESFNEIVPHGLLIINNDDREEAAGMWSYYKVTDPMSGGGKPLALFRVEGLLSSVTKAQAVGLNPRRRSRAYEHNWHGGWLGKLRGS